MNALSIYGRSPFDLIDSIFSGDNLFDQSLRGPVVDVREEKDRYVIDAELPGMNEKDIRLEIKDGILHLSTQDDTPRADTGAAKAAINDANVKAASGEAGGEASGAAKGAEVSADEKRWICRERRSFKFSRSFSLPEDADENSIEATFRDGLLTVILPRKPESAPRLVQVKAA